MVDEKEEEEEEEESQRFKISDRRQFTVEGKPRPGVDPQAESREAPPAPPQKPPEEGSESLPGPSAPDTMDFASFLLSLATTGMVHLGEIPDPGTGQTSENPDAAKQMIDILSVLKLKTNGNLSADEARLLDSLLYELRMKLMTKSKVIRL